AEAPLERGHALRGEVRGQARVAREHRGVVLGILAQTLDSLANHLERLAEGALGLGIPERREAFREKVRDDQRESEGGNERDEEEKCEKALPEGAEHGPSAALPPRAARLGFAGELPARRADLDSLAVAHGDRGNARPKVLGEALDSLGGGAFELPRSDRIV